MQAQISSTISLEQLRSEKSYWALLSGFGGSNEISMLDFRKNSGFGRIKSQKLIKHGIANGHVALLKKPIFDIDRQTWYRTTYAWIDRVDSEVEKQTVRVDSEVEKQTVRVDSEVEKWIVRVDSEGRYRGPRHGPLSLGIDSAEKASHNRTLKTTDLRITTTYPDPHPPAPIRSSSFSENADVEALPGPDSAPTANTSKKDQKQALNERSHLNPYQHTDQPQKSNGAPLRLVFEEPRESSPLDELDLPKTARSWLSKEYSKSEIEIAMARLKKWKRPDHVNDQQAIRSILKKGRENDWKDQNTKADRLQLDLERLKGLSHLHKKQVGNTSIWVSLTPAYIEFTASRPYQPSRIVEFRAGDKDFNDNLDRMLSQLKISHSN
jgi:hypothetical protein